MIKKEVTERDELLWGLLTWVTVLLDRMCVQLICGLWCYPLLYSGRGRHGCRPAVMEDEDCCLYVRVLDHM